MPIAKVRIAPVEQWCEPEREKAKKYPLAVSLAGKAAIIEPASMQTGFGFAHTADIHCDGRTWKLTPESAEELSSTAGTRAAWVFSEVWICEHMLEMD